MICTGKSARYRGDGFRISAARPMVVRAPEVTVSRFAVLAPRAGRSTPNVSPSKQVGGSPHYGCGARAPC